MRTNNIFILLTLHPQFIKDADGKKSWVVLKVKEFDSIIEKLDMKEDVRLYDKAKKNYDGERIPAAEAFKMIEAKRKKKL
jgi:hypothetical protein